MLGQVPSMTLHGISWKIKSVTTLSQIVAVTADVALLIFLFALSCHIDSLDGTLHKLVSHSVPACR